MNLINCEIYQRERVSRHRTRTTDRTPQPDHQVGLRESVQTQNSYY